MHTFLNRIASWLFWNAGSRTFVWLWLRPRFHFRKTPGSDPIPKPPFIVVANHGTFFDPWICGGYSRHPFSFMCNDDAFRSPPFSRWYLTKIGCFPKKKGAVDFKAVKETLRRLAAKRAVCIFPEGQTSWDGETQLIYRGIETLARKAGCSLVMIRLGGNFLTKPWWAQTRRDGRITVDFKVLKAGAITSMTDPQVFDVIRTHIYQNDIKDPRNQKVRFTGKRLAQGMERFVWWCPACDSEDHLVTEGDVIRCEQCGNGWVIDPWCRLTPATPGAPQIGDLHDWSLWHRAKVKERISAAGPAEVLTRSAGVLLQKIAPDGWTFVDQGAVTIHLTNEMLFCTGAVEFACTVADVRDCVIQKKDIFECRIGQIHHRFVFSGRSPMKWVQYLRYLHGYGRLEEQGHL